MNLRPCPFCGKEAHIERKGDRRQSTIYRCNFCGCSLETGEEWGFGTQWNDRSGAAKAENEKLKEAMDRYKKVVEYIGTCGDGNCVILRPVGMHTNGGCKCWNDPMKAQRMMWAGQTLYNAAKEYIE